MKTKEDTSYNGWTNYETWNVALWIDNDESLYLIAKQSPDYRDFINTMHANGFTETPDGVAYNDSGLDLDALNAMMEEL